MPAPASSFTLSVTLGEHSFSASGKHDLVLKAFEDFKVLTGQGDVPDAAEQKRTAVSKSKTIESCETFWQHDFAPRSLHG
jgi:hypothetical protein